MGSLGCKAPCHDLYTGVFVVADALSGREHLEKLSGLRNVITAALTEKLVYMCVYSIEF